MLCAIFVIRIVSSSWTRIRRLPRSYARAPAWYDLWPRRCRLCTTLGRGGSVAFARVLRSRAAPRARASWRDSPLRRSWQPLCLWGHLTAGAARPGGHRRAVAGGISYRRISGSSEARSAKRRETRKTPEREREHRPLEHPTRRNGHAPATRRTTSRRRPVRGAAPHFAETHRAKQRRARAGAATARDREERCRAEHPACSKPCSASSASSGRVLGFPSRSARRALHAGTLWYPPCRVSALLRPTSDVTAYIRDVRASYYRLSPPCTPTVSAMVLSNTDCL